MFRYIYTIVLLFFFWNNNVVAQNNQDRAQTFLQKCIKVVGDVNSINSLYWISTGHYNKSVITSTLSWVAPYKIIIDNNINNLHSTTIYNDIGSYYIAHYPTCEQKEGEKITITKIASDVNSHNFSYPHYMIEFLDKLKHDYLLSYQKDTIMNLPSEQAKCFILRLTHNYFYKDFFFDSETYLLKAILNGNTMQQEITLLGNYKKVDGLMFPCSIKVIQQNTGNIISEHTYDLIMTNIDIPFNKFDLNYYK